MLWHLIELEILLPKIMSLPPRFFGDGSFAPFFYMATNNKNLQSWVVEYRQVEEKMRKLVNEVLCLFSTLIYHLPVVLSSGLVRIPPQGYTGQVVETLQAVTCQ